MGYVYIRGQRLFPIDLSGPQDTTRFVRHVARQISGIYTLRMMVKVANWQVIETLWLSQPHFD